MTATKSNPEFARDLKWYSLSAAIHASLFVLLLTVSGTLTKNGGVFSSAAQEKARKEAEAGATLDLSPYLEEVHIFDGISYTDYKNNKLRKAQAQSQASDVLAKLKGLKLPSGGSKATGGLSAGAAVNVGGGSLLGKGQGAVGEAALLDSLRKQPFTFKASLPSSGATAGASRTISDKERAEIRQKFNALQQSFRKVYAKGLTIDPHLEATVGFEARVKNDGFLEVIRFRTRGKFKDESIELMKTEMGKLIAQLSLSPELSGTVIRGESVFAR